MLSIQDDISSASDETLIQQYQQTRNKELVGELYRRYHHLVYGTCLKFLKDKTESSDLVVLIFEKIIRKLAVSDVQHFNSWLYSLCQNECVNYIRRQSIRRRKQEGWVEEEKPKEVSIENEAVLQACERELREMEEQEEEDSRAQVRAAVAKLPREQMICISLFFFKEKSYQQIAEKTKYSLPQVKSYLQNGKRNLKKLLAEEFS